MPVFNRPPSLALAYARQMEGASEKCAEDYRANGGSIGEMRAENLQKLNLDKIYSILPLQISIGQMPLQMPMPVFHTTTLAFAYARQMEGESGKWREHRANG